MTPRRLAEIDAAFPALGSLHFVDELSQAVEINTGDIPALLRLGKCYLQHGEWLRGVSAFRIATALDPVNVTAWLELGDALAQGGAYLEALRIYERSLTLAPDSWITRFSVAQGRHLLCQIDEAIEDYDKALAMQSEAIMARSFRIVALNYREDNQEKLLAESRAYAVQIESKVESNFDELMYTDKVVLVDRIRVGILSSDLRVHSVTYFLVPLLDRIPMDIDVILYHDSIHSDAMTDRLVLRTAEFVSAVGMDNSSLIEKMRSDRLDVAIDLGGHFSRNRLPVFAARVAPVQVSYLGYPNTTGLKAMDWRIGDEAIDGFIGSTDHWTERLEAMRSGMLAYEPPSDAPPISPSPKNMVFGYFGHMGKISPDVAKVWGELLNVESESGARMLIKGEALADAGILSYWKTKLLSWGLDTDRVDFVSKTASRAEHLQLYSKVSVTLDTWPYNGTTTTCESLWMGVPVVTLQGSRHSSRVGAAILNGVTMPGCCCKTKESYIATAGSLTKTRWSRADLANASWLKHDAIAEEFWSLIMKFHKDRK